MKYRPGLRPGNGKSPNAPMFRWLFRPASHKMSQNLTTFKAFFQYTIGSLGGFQLVMAVPLYPKLAGWFLVLRENPIKTDDN